MHHLPNGCKCSNIGVTPKNWNKKGSTTSKDWRIFYKFYDPTFPKFKLVQIKAGINTVKNLAERRQLVTELIENEWVLLKEKGYNPITGTMLAPIEMEYEIDPDTPFIKALEKAKDKLSVGDRTRIGIKSVIKGVAKAAEQLRFTSQPICKVSRRHLKMILEQCGKNSNKWSNGRYNLYRAYLLMLFKELVELEATPGNPVRDISKKPVVQKMKIVLSSEQRKEVNDHLHKAFPRFYAFVHLFFHSGGRKTELLQLKPGNVDLVRQKYRCIIKKGKNPKEVERTIKTVAVPYWETFMKDCPADHFLFGKLFEPGKKPMGLEMPSRYWKKYVKEGLGINVDFYSLKHLNTSEVVDALDEGAAAELNAHASTAMVVNIYDVKQKERQHERLKGVNNLF